MTFSLALVTTFALVLLRCAGLCLTAPVIGVAYVPPPVRLLFAVALSAVVVASSPLVAAPLDGVALAGRALTETLVGLAAGLSARFFIDALAGAGSAAGLGMGLGFANTVDPVTGAQATALSRLFVTLGLIAAVELGIHREVAAWAVWAGHRVAFGGQSDILAIAEAVLSQALGSIVFAIRLGYPVLAAVTLGHLSLGLLGRVSPQLNMQSVGLSIAVVAGGAIVFVSAPNIGLLAAQKMHDVLMAWHVA